MAHVALDYDAATGVAKITGKKWKADHVIHNLPPKTTKTEDLGSASKRYAELYAANINLLTLLYPQSATINIKDSGDTSRIQIYPIDQTSVSVKPFTNNTGQLGDSSYKWKELHATTVNYDTFRNERTLLLEVNGKQYAGDGSAHTIDESQTRVACNYINPTYMRQFCYNWHEADTWLQTWVRDVTNGNNLCYAANTYGSEGYAFLGSAWYSSLIPSNDVVVCCRYQVTNGKNVKFYAWGVELR